MKTQYNDIEISYIEGTNTWEFVLRGRHRTCDSLAAAKEAIDKVPAEKREAFPKFDAYLFSYGGQRVVTVTSLAEGNRYDKRTEFWVSENGKRSKEMADYLYPVNDHNTAIIAQLAETKKEKELIDKRETEIRSKLQSAQVPAVVAEE